MTHKTTHWSLVAACMIFVSACGAPEDEEVDPVGVFVGELAGSDVRIGVVRNEQAVQFYVCGGASTFATHSRWFKGDADADADTYTFEKDGWTITGELGNRITGTLTPPGSGPMDFDIPRAAADTLEGVYDNKDNTCRTGAVVMRIGGTLQVQGTWCAPGGEMSQVTPIAPVTLTAQGIEVEIDTGSNAGSHFFISPVSPESIIIQ